MPMLLKIETHIPQKVILESNLLYCAILESMFYPTLSQRLYKQKWRLLLVNIAIIKGKKICALRVNASEFDNLSSTAAM